MKGIIFLCFCISLASCSQIDDKDSLEGHKRIAVVNSDSLLIESMIKQQQFDLVKSKADSILPLKPLSQRGYYYFQKGFSDIMLENHKEAISNFKRAISLGYEVRTSKAMIITAKKMQLNYDQHN